MANMATMAIYGKKPLKEFTKTNYSMVMKFVCSFEDASIFKIIRIMTLGWAWPFYGTVDMEMLEYEILFENSENLSWNLENTVVLMRNW